MANVIDALVVTLGLDSKAFASGIKGSTKDLAGLTRSLAGMFLAVRGLEDVIGYFRDLHHELAGVGFTAMSLGVVGTELTKLGETSELFGGHMTDAARSIETLQSSLFQLKYNGQMSEQLLMLQRFGVGYLNARGQMLSMKQIAENAAKRMDELQKGGMSQGMRYQLALQMGFSGGLATAVSRGSAALNKALGESTRDQKSLTNRTIAGQVALARELTRNSARIAASSSVMLAQLTPAIEHLTKEITALVTYLEHKLEPLLKTWIPRIDKDLQAFEGFARGVLGGGKESHAQLASEPWYERAAKNVGHGLGLTGLEELGTRFVRKRFGFMAAGAEALGGHYKKAGKLALSALSWEVAVGMMLNEYLERTTPRLNSWSALFGGASGSGSLAQIPLTSLPPRLPPTPGATLGRRGAAQAGAGGPLALVGAGGTNVEIGSITVNTRATDANGVAAGLASALKRKLLVADAERGQR